MKTPFLNHTMDDWLLLATAATLNHSRSHLMKFIALPTDNVHFYLFCVFIVMNKSTLS